jgi:hypothetical protein
MNHQDPSVLTSQMRLLAGNVTVRPTEGKEEDLNQKHFKTDHLLPNLKRHTILSGAITMSAQAGRFLLNLVFTVIRARLLTPRDFGLVAMVTTVTATGSHLYFETLRELKKNR